MPTKHPPNSLSPYLPRPSALVGVASIGDVFGEMPIFMAPVSPWDALARDLGVLGIDMRSAVRTLNEEAPQGRLFDPDDAANGH